MEMSYLKGHNSKSSPCSSPWEFSQTAVILNLNETIIFLIWWPFRCWSSYYYPNPLFGYLLLTRSSLLISLLPSPSTQYLWGDFKFQSEISSSCKYNVQWYSKWGNEDVHLQRLPRGQIDDIMLWVTAIIICHVEMKLLISMKLFAFLTNFIAMLPCRGFSLIPLIEAKRASLMSSNFWNFRCVVQERGVKVYTYVIEEDSKSWKFLIKKSRVQFYVLYNTYSIQSISEDG